MKTPQSVAIRVLFFAKARELSGQTECEVNVPSKISVENLLNTICDNYSLNIIKNNIILALNEDYCEEGQVELELKDGDEVAIIPPISGG